MLQRALSGARLRSNALADTLTPQQEAVIDALLDGCTQKDAATRGDVAPETVSWWMHGDALFVATLNARRAEVWRATRDRKAQLRTKALDALGELLESEDERVRLRVALALLKVDGEPPKAPTEPEDVEIAWKRAQRNRALDEMLAMV